MAFIGNTNTTQAFTPAIDYFSGNGSTVAFTLSRPVASVAQVQANISNVPQNPGSAYTVSGNTITFTSAPPSGTNNIYVYYTSPITQVIAPGQGTVTTTSMASSTGTGAGVFQTSPTIISPVITGSTPQITVYTSGSGTYTVPANARWLQVRMVGGGGGGGGSGTAGGTGGTGGATTFGSSLLTANGGTGGIDNGAGGSGGSASIGAGASGIALSGGNGGGADAGSANNLAGGMGGSSAFGGNGGCGGGDSAGSPNASPTAGQTNTGGGGGGASFSGSFGAGGGGAGGYVDAIVSPLSATYSYAVGAAGTAGTAGTGTATRAGGAGGSGVIYITAYF